MRELVGRTGFGLCRHDEPTGHERVERTLIRRVGDELVARSPHACIRRGHHSLEEHRRRRALVRTHSFEHAVGVTCERTGHSAELVDVLAADHRARCVARFPHLGERELQERQSAFRAGRLGDEPRNELG